MVMVWILFVVAFIILSAAKGFFYTLGLFTFAGLIGLILIAIDSCKDLEKRGDKDADRRK